MYFHQNAPLSFILLTTIPTRPPIERTPASTTRTMATSTKRKSFTRAWNPHIFALYENGDYSDHKIKCQDRTFNVHKAIVCPQSPVLAAAVNGKFKVRIPLRRESKATSTSL